MSILRRLSSSRFSEVLPHWRGQTVALLGGGPSLTIEQMRVIMTEHLAKRLKCIAINDSYLLAPWADLHYAADSSWHKWHTDGIARPSLGLSAAQVAERWASFAGEKCSIQNSGGNIIDDRVHLLRNMSHPSRENKLSFNPTALGTGRNSGFQALNLAMLAGAKTILLLGFDLREWDPKSHWHDGHPRNESVHVAYPEFRKAFSAIENDVKAAGVRVINCSPISELGSFEKLSLDQALALRVEAAA